jgi:DNA replication and repair protein RecF
MARINGNDLSGYGSQGENRLASLSLKIAIRDLLQSKTKQSPLLLLDDVTSDLDEKRCQNLLSTIDSKGQVFITGTRINEGFSSYEVYETNGTDLVRRNLK